MLWIRAGHFQLVVDAAGEGGGRARRLRKEGESGRASERPSDEGAAQNERMRDRESSLEPSGDRLRVL